MSNVKKSPQPHSGANGDHAKDNPAPEGSCYLVFANTGAHKGNGETGKKNPDDQEHPFPPVHTNTPVFHPGFKSQDTNGGQYSFNKPEQTAVEKSHGYLLLKSMKSSDLNHHGDL
jgi:hypothetical protein